MQTVQTTSAQGWQYLSFAPYVKTCVTEDGLVLLDLKRNGYFGLGLAECEALQRANVTALHEPPSPSSDARETSVDESALVNRLLTQKILIRSPAPADASRRAPPNATQELLPVDDQPGSCPSVGVWQTMAGACLWAHWMMKVRSLELVVRQLSRGQISRHKRPSSPPDLSEVRERVRSFFWMRPFIYSDEGQCLFETLALLRYLVSFEIWPTWIIGVQTRPFLAHTWLQWDGYVINGLPGHVREFRPILVV